MKVLAVMEALSLTGPAKNLVRFAQLAGEMGTEVTLATFRRAENPPEDDFVRAARAAGVRLEILPDRGPWDWRGGGEIRRLSEGLGVDVVQTHNVKSHFLVSLVGVRKGAAWVAWNHGYTWPTWRQRVYNSFDYHSLQRADLVVTVTEAFVAGLLARGVRRERVVVVSNAIDPTVGIEAAALRREDYTAPGERIVVAVGRLSLEKGHSVLLRALAGEGLSRHVLVLVGDGPEREPLRRLAAELGVKLVLAGQVSQVRPFYDLADVFVLPSESEGSPNVLLEAMLAGLPIVSTDVGGVKETVDDGCEAVLVAPNSPEQIGDALRRLEREPEWAAELGRRARERVIAERSPEKRTQRILKHYEELLG